MRTVMPDRWTEHLSEYIDGELAGPDRSALEAHLATCAACRATLDELRAVVARANAVRDREPARDLWPAIRREVLARRIRPAGGESKRWTARVVTLPLGRAAAAAALVAVVSAAVAWSLASRNADSERASAAVTPAGDDRRPAAAASGPTDSLGSVDPSAFAVASYRDAVAELEEALAASRSTLRPETSRIIEENLRTIDQAIAQADSALRRDPASAYLHQHLAATMQRKLKLLRLAVEISAARS